MACACGSKGFGAVLAVAGAAAVGLGGYNWYTTGCPLGACHKGDEAGAVINTADTSGVKAGHSCCEEGVDSLQAKSEPAGHSCCEAGAKAECCEKSEADKAKEAEKAKESKDMAKAPADKPAGG